MEQMNQTEKGEPMAEYIERESVIESIIGEPTESHYPSWYADKIKEIPTADVAPVVHGLWVIVDDGVMIGDGKHMECAVCHTWSKDRIKANYCPNCGARMDGERKENG